MFLLFPHFTFIGTIFSVSLECSYCSLIYFTFLGPIFSVSLECSYCSFILLSLTQYFQFHSNVLAVPSFYFPWDNIFSFTRMFLLFLHFTFLGTIFSVSLECSCCSLILLSLAQYFQFQSNVLAVPSFYFPWDNIFSFTRMFLLFPHLLYFPCPNIFSFTRMFLLFPHFTFPDPLFSVSLECSCCSLIYFTSLTQYFQFHSNVLAVPSFYFPWPNIFSFTRMFLLFPHFTFPDPIFSVSLECSCCSLILLSLTQYFQFHSNVLAVPSFTLLSLPQYFQFHSNVLAVPSF